ncbi:MAG TPA: bile acid:sodium symporter [Oligoflexus sp.]|uniref:bile acid:sodium symporter family protein n=1 Tax=Oligoflexus sp. TaxID=1971216 RepID=UPI002D55293D|nr:bile acid:sodium symporter [Oligoflexus sp.]HYX37763.1 bile acid:sodium symporter [Oligoflexus sp.]
MVREIVQFLLGNLVFFFMLVAGLEIDLRDVRQFWRRPGTVALCARALLIVFVGLPILALSIVSIIPMPLPLKGLILLIAICPGKLFILKNLRKAEANIPLAVNVTSLVVLASPFLVPIWVSVTGRIHTVDMSLSSFSVLDLTLRKVLVPFAAGVLLRHLAPQWARSMSHFVDRVASVALLLAIALILILGVPNLGQLVPGGLAAIFTITAGGILMGLGAGGPRPDEQNAVMQATVPGDPTLVLAIVAQNFPEARIQALLAACIVARTFMLIPLQRWVKAGLSHSRTG